MLNENALRKFLLLTSTAFAYGWASDAMCYQFTIGPFPEAHKVTAWFTGEDFKRLGDAVFDGVLPANTKVERSTVSSKAFDHSVVIDPDKKLSWNDTFFPGQSLVQVTTGPFVVPVLLPVSEFSNIFYIVNVPEWVSGNGAFSPDQVYSNFSNGTNSLLPGFTVGISSDPNLTIEDAFSIDPVTGVVAFSGAIPLNTGDGSVFAASSQTIAAIPEPGSLCLLSLGLLGYVSIRSGGKR